MRIGRVLSLELPEALGPHTCLLSNSSAVHAAEGAALEASIQAPTPRLGERGTAILIR